MMMKNDVLYKKSSFFITDVMIKNIFKILKNLK